MNEVANYGHIIVFSLVGGIVSLIGGVLLLSKKKLADNLAKYATPFAAGALLAAVFLDLLSEGVAGSEPNTVFMAALAGILLFFMAERFLHWFHHHHEHDTKHTSPGASLIVIGDTLHNALDGVAIAAAFLVSVPTGIVTTIAVAAHEIPQEIGDFGLLLNKGVSRRKVLAINVVSSLATVVAAVITFSLGNDNHLPTGVLLGLSAGFLLYIATSDIIPEIHEKTRGKRLLDAQPMLLLAGVLLVGLTIDLAHSFVDTGHDHNHAHEHSGFEMPDHDGLPEIKSMALKKDSMNGYNLILETVNFKFSPEAVGEGVKAGEGHAHVYINGKKSGRMYGHVMHLDDVRPGDVIRVTLNVNDHRDIIHDGAPIAAEIVVKEDGAHRYYETATHESSPHKTHTHSH